MESCFLSVVQYCFYWVVSLTVLLAAEVAEAPDSSQQPLCRGEILHTYKPLNITTEECYILNVLCFRAVTFLSSKYLLFAFFYVCSFVFKLYIYIIDKFTPADGKILYKKHPKSYDPLHLNIQKKIITENFHTTVC